ncbi:MAG: carbamoyltransferase [Deltaproteobacteria bacterium]|nr:carbamoyltransferase [Deltaproteobacteria bacterium]
MTKATYILGISAFYHDSAVALIRDGEILYAAQEERFTRVKHDSGFPHQALSWCLREAGITLDDVVLVVFYDKPMLKFERILSTYVAFAPRGLLSFHKAMPLWLKQKLNMRSLLSKELDVDPDRVRFTMHHEAHAASAFFPSPFQESAILTMDGVGEWQTTSLCAGRGNHIEFLKEMNFPHSLGLLYSAFTYYTGFRVNSGEYKLMGLAPYGEARYVDRILDEIVDLKDDGSFRLNLKVFDYCVGLTMTNRRFDRIFGGPPRKPESPVTQREMDIAKSIQQVTEEIVLRMAATARRVTGMNRLCLAGGVALNCVANGKLLRKGIFDDIWIQPAAGDAGGALGAALATWHSHLDQPRTADGTRDAQKWTQLGPAFDNKTIEEHLKARGRPYEKMDEGQAFRKVPALLEAGRVVGLFQGRMEFGPRALGNRSIIGDARSAKMQKTMNLKIKYRESFRPFAPSVLLEKTPKWFEFPADHSSPYMLLVADVAEGRRTPMTPEQEDLFGVDKLNVARSEVPAVTHVDCSARLQTVSREQNPFYHGLISAFEKRTGCPVIVNTSFNVRGEPIVCTPEDAYRCFMRTEMDSLLLGDCLLHKDGQPPLEESGDWRHVFQLD